MKLRYLNEKTEYPIEFSRLSSHVVYITGDLPAKAKGFLLIRDKYDTVWADYSEFNTIYREMEDGVQFSDDGSTWSEPETDFIVKATWNDEDDFEGLRPESVTVTVYKGNEVLEEAILNAENDWQKTYHDVVSALYSIGGEEVEGYTMNVSDLIISYYHEVHHQEEPTIEERVADLEGAVCELSEIIGEL